MAVSFSATMVSPFGPRPTRVTAIPMSLVCRQELYFSGVLNT